MEPITVAIPTALAQGQVQVSKKLLEDEVLDLAVEPVTERLKGLVQRGYRKEDSALLAGVRKALCLHGSFVLYSSTCQPNLPHSASLRTAGGVGRLL